MKRSGTKRSSSKNAERRSDPKSLGRVLLFCLITDAFLIAGLCAVSYWAYREVSLEKGYQKQYGLEWQDEFQRYHGLLSHVHAQITVCALGLLALTAIVTWLCVRIFQQRSIQRFTYHSV